jgi:hypothetical protein
LPILPNLRPSLLILPPILNVTRHIILSGTPQPVTE